MEQDLLEVTSVIAIQKTLSFKEERRGFLQQKTSFTSERKQFFKVDINNEGNLSKNDIIVLGSNGKPMHLGIYLGNGLMLHHPRNKFATTEQINETFSSFS